MNRRTVTATLAAAAALAVAGTAGQSFAQQQEHPGMEKCFGIAAHGANDCAAGAHSCAGQASRDRDPSSFVYLPAGACGKIAGGKLKAA